MHDFVARATNFVAHATDSVAHATDFVAHATNFVACATDFVACGMLITTPVGKVITQNQKLLFSYNSGNIKVSFQNFSKICLVILDFWRQEKICAMRHQT